MNNNKTNNAQALREAMQKEISKILSEAQLPDSWEQAVDSRQEYAYLQDKLDTVMKGFHKPFQAKTSKQYLDSFVYINAKDKPELIKHMDKQGYEYYDERNAVGRGSQYFKLKKENPNSVSPIVLKTKKV